MLNFINRLHRSEFLGRIFPTLNYCLQRELVGCQSVLDIGCGPSSPLQYCANIKYSIGVEPFEPYLEKSKSKKIHTDYLNRKIEELNFDDSSFDAVMMIELIEHLPKELGFEVLKKAERWARKKVIVSTPSGFISQKEVDGNPLQRHLSGWSLKELQDLGYRCRGLAGLRCLRQEVRSETMGDDLTVSIRFWPASFWFIVASLSQLVTYWFPKLAFGLFCAKEMGKGHNDIHSGYHLLERG